MGRAGEARQLAMCRWGGQWVRCKLHTCLRTWGAHGGTGNSGGASLQGRAWPSSPIPARQHRQSSAASHLADSVVERGGVVSFPHEAEGASEQSERLCCPARLMVWDSGGSRLCPAARRYLSSSVRPVGRVRAAERSYGRSRNIAAVSASAGPAPFPWATRGVCSHAH